MNSFIEMINQWGGRFADFAWPMFWQSSLLIVVLFAMDFLLQRRIRASVRYALWLVVLVKLCLPPTLALPTNPAWWLHTNSPAVKPQLHYTVRYDSQPLPVIPQHPTPVYVPPRPAMTGTAWCLAASGIVSILLLAGLLLRWGHISRRVRHAIPSERLTAVLNRARHFSGKKPAVPVKVTGHSLSPAVCGLLRPTILIPQSLAEEFSDDQLRAVLLHEMVHLRRRDVWMNFLQALLQIVYWWHPLLWLANARIRRVREEAVDDAVMLALRKDASSYPPTLLEVAKLALNRPLASLGLVGILESRSALRQRIERLVHFRAPRKAGLTFASLFGICVFSAVALPMGEAPRPTPKPTTSLPVGSVPSASVSSANLPSVLIAAEFYRMPESDFQALISDLPMQANQGKEDSWWLVSPEKFPRLKSALRQAHFNPLVRPRIQTLNRVAARMWVSNGTDRYEFDCTPVVSAGRVDLMVQGYVFLDNQKAAATHPFQVNAYSQNSGGIVIRPEQVEGSVVDNLVGIIGIQLVANLVSGGRVAEGTPATAFKTLTFRLNHPVREIELKEALKAAGVTNPTTAYFYTDAGMLVVHGSEAQLARVKQMVLKLNGFSANEIRASDAALAKDRPVPATTDEDRTNLFSRTFKVGANVFAEAVRNIPGLKTNDTSAIARTLFSKMGVDWKMPEGKSVIYNDRLGLLFVRATESDLDTAEKVIEALNETAPQIHIKARFWEVPKGTLDGFAKFISITNQPSQIVGILLAQNARAVLRMLESRSGVEELAAPEVTTGSGRRTLIRGTVFQTITTNFVFQQGVMGRNSIIPQTTTLETGPILDTVATVLPDNCTIDLKAVASRTEFLGYDKPPTNLVEHINDSGDHATLPVVLPVMRVSKADAHLKIWDGQTVVLRGVTTTHSATVRRMERATAPDGGQTVESPVYREQVTRAKTQKELLVLITVTMVDRVGNRVHSEDQIPSAKDSIPAQDNP